MLKSESSDEKSFCGHEPGRDGCIDLIYSIIGGGGECCDVTECVCNRDGQKIGYSTATNRVWLRGQRRPEDRAFNRNQPCMVAWSAESLPPFALENLVSGDRFGCSVPFRAGPLILHNQAEWVGGW